MNNGAEYVIGMDGGGTKTLLKLADINGKLLATCEGGPSNICSASTEDIKRELESLISRGLKIAGKVLDKCGAVCIGAAGAGRQGDADVMEGIIRSIGFKGELIVTDDARTALYGGIGSETGAILVSGTGSICFGRNSAGDTHRTGGWGHIIGDEGSGYSIAVEALKHVMREYDGREKSTALTEAVLSGLKLNGPEELISYVYRKGNGKKEISGIAKIVDRVCEQGDAAAVRIQKNAAKELYLCVKAVIDKLKFENNRVELAIGGSVITGSKFIENEFRSLVNRSYPLVNIFHMKNDAAWGAVCIALDRLEYERN